ncbi:MAG: hypothetical protein ACRDFR_01260, partial [Candidatus Limnocylindria bacterium]
PELDRNRLLPTLDLPLICRLIVIAEQFASRAPGPAVHAIHRLLDLNYHLALCGRTYRYADASGGLTDAALPVPGGLAYARHSGPAWRWQN